VVRRLWLGFGLTLLGACRGGVTNPTPQADPNLAFCVQETNRYRAMVGKAALSESTSVEAFAAAAAQSDTRTGIPHGYFHSNDPGFGGENEAPDWSLTQFGSEHNVMTQAIAAFWSEGPGGGHFENIVGPYSQLGCGIYQTGSDLTLVQDFR
jgi:uncharacterized protein YkwD